MSEFNPYVPPPEALRVWIGQHPRVEAIDNHGFDLKLDWWNSRIPESQGAPVTGRSGETGQGFISRGHIFALAETARDDESGIGAVRLFWHALAWGTGSSHRNSPRRIESVLGNDDVRLLLRGAAGLSVTDPRGAFLLLKPGRNAISSLGPNFFTKFLYFAGGGALGHSCLIVDNRVLRSLHRETGRPLLDPNQPTNYGPAVYEDALLVMKAWAKELSQSGRIVGADEVERWAFATGRRPSRTGIV
ncbi:hypothetical protein [Pseudarthrobacter defluvii]|uniref:8-oxoguanine DNA glycosylase OGG fold protein n=1 Tax=Pseudarthrobacter defluvii TaxID=410837 RepID=UPI002575AAB4|nr:hypothetical protein [Pseudarthrobacter defluvii]WJH25432.1 hypothetical protein JCQ34_04940 [Pseudarthrobacter defluvii]